MTRTMLPVHPRIRICPRVLGLVLTMTMTLTTFLMLPAPPAVAQDQPGQNELPLPTAASALPDLSLEALSATRERPLFAPLRRPPAPPPTAPVAIKSEAPPPPPAEPSPPPFELTGVIVGGGAGIALLHNTQNQKMIQLKLNETAEGWTLKSVDSHSIVLSQGDREEDLALPDKYKCEDCQTAVGKEPEKDSEVDSSTDGEPETGAGAAPLTGVDLGKAGMPPMPDFERLLHPTPSPQARPPKVAEPAKPNRLVPPRLPAPGASPPPELPQSPSSNPHHSRQKTPPPGQPRPR